MVEEDEILVLEFRQTLPIGLGVLAIAFEGTLNDKMKGFYRRYVPIFPFFFYGVCVCWGWVVGGGGLVVVAVGEGVVHGHDFYLHLLGTD